MVTRDIKNIVVIGYNRHEYWKQCISGIRAAVDELDYRDITFFAFLDGPNSNETQQSVDFFKATFEGCNSRIEQQNSNLGSDRHIHYALENSVGQHLKKADETYLIVEDDVVLNANSLVNLNRMMSAHDQGNIGSFQLWNENLGTFDALVSASVMPVESTQCHWWGYTLDSLTYQLIRPFLLKYYEIVKETSHKNRPNKQIRELFHGELERFNEWLENEANTNNYKIPWNKAEFQRIRKHPAMSQDMAMAVSLLGQRLIKVAPYFAMCSNIGVNGAHMSPQIHERVTAGIKEVKEVAIF